MTVIISRTGPYCSQNLATATFGYIWPCFSKWWQLNTGNRVELHMYWGWALMFIPRWVRHGMLGMLEAVVLSRAKLSLSHTQHTHFLPVSPTHIHHLFSLNMSYWFIQLLLQRGPWFLYIMSNCINPTITWSAFEHPLVIRGRQTGFKWKHLLCSIKKITPVVMGSLSL